MRFLLPAVACALLAAPLLHAQNFTPLDFSHNIQATNGIYPNNSIIGPNFYSGHIFDFADVATVDGRTIDARVTLLNISDGYQFDGWVPAFNGPGNSNYGYPDNGIDPGDDFGVYYKSTPGLTQPTAGTLSLSISFYEGGGTFNIATSLEELSLLLYDHDGEPGQSEAVRAYVSDGLAGYQLHNASGITATNEGATVRFDASGTNKPELTAQGGFILNYHNVSTIRLDLLANTLPSNPSTNNGIFLAIDGNLGLVNPSDFGIYQAVPEPSASLLAAVLAGLIAFRRKR